MKKLVLITAAFILPLLVVGQTITCDTAAIFATNDTNAVCIEVVKKVRYCFSNNYPNHSDNYNQPMFTLSADDEEYSMCAYPDTSTTFTPLYEEVETTAGCTDIYIFGVLLNGVRLDPSSGDVFVRANGTNNINWHVEATSPTNSIGANMGTLNGGHLNPFGDYHYHAIPTDYFVNDLGIDGTSHSPIVGYAADGFPIYYKYVYQDASDSTSAVTALSSGYSLQSGTRPGNGQSAPDGTYDGSYYEDYEYTTTTLDACNGRYAVTPDFPYGTYYYVLTDNYPYIPRCFKGEEVDNTFRVGPAASCPDSEASMNCPARVSGCMDPFADNYNSSANVDDGSCSYSTLPVELIYFSVKEKDDEILLTWKTANETGNNRFEIEWSKNGFQFENIGKVAGSGTTLTKQSYEFLHPDPVDGYNYYRLKQVDFDQTFEYSNIIVITHQGARFSRLKIYPNPAKDWITLETPVAQTVFVKNIYGQILIQSEVIGRQRMDLSILPSGVYFISNGTQLQKLMLERL